MVGGEGGGGLLVRGQNALFKIAMKQYLECLIILDVRGGEECFIYDSRKAIFRTLDNACS